MLPTGTQISAIEGVCMCVVYNMEGGGEGVHLTLTLMTQPKSSVYYTNLIIKATLKISSV